MRACLAVAVLIAAGCTCSDGVCMGTMAAPRTQFLATAGQPVTVTVLNAVECGSRTPENVTVSTLDPSITPVPTTATSPVVLPGRGFTTDVTFTPEVPGQYHVVARFEPNFGQAEVDVLVAADRRDAGSVAAVGCPRGDFTPGGLTLCYRGTGVDVLGPMTDNIPGGRFARSGGTLWASNGSTIRRYVEDGGAFVLTQTGQVQPHRAIIAGADDALLIADPIARLLWWTDGGTRDTLYVPPTDDVWWNGERVVTVGTVTGWCVRTLGADAGERCSKVGDEVLRSLGASPDGVAVDRTLPSDAVEAIMFDDTTSASLRLPPGSSLGRLGGAAWDTVAVLTGFGDAGIPPLVLRRSTNGIILEDYGPDVRAVTSTCVTTGTRLIRR